MGQGTHGASCNRSRSLGWIDFRRYLSRVSMAQALILESVRDGTLATDRRLHTLSMHCAFTYLRQSSHVHRLTGSVNGAFGKADGLGGRLPQVAVIEAKAPHRESQDPSASGIVNGATSRFSAPRFEVEERLYSRCRSPRSAVSQSRNLSSA